jgi:hypothetical protein
LFFRHTNDDCAKDELKGQIGLAYKHQPRRGSQAGRHIFVTRPVFLIQQKDSPYLSQVGASPEPSQ